MKMFFFLLRNSTYRAFLPQINEKIKCIELETASANVFYESSALFAVLMAKEYKHWKEIR